jgi:hypothetical protein
MPAMNALRFASLALVASIAAGLAGCKETSVSEVPVEVDRIDFGSNSISVEVGSTASVTAVPKSSSGQSLTARTVQFSSSNPSVLQVTGSGQTAQLTGVAAGTASVTATSGSASNMVSVTVTRPDLALNVDNHLLSPIEVSVDGTVIGTVPARPIAAAVPTRRTFQIAGTPQFTLDWDLVRPTIPNSSVGLGEEVGGRFEMTVGNQTSFDFIVDNEIAGTVYFAPVITNNTVARLLMLVNFGLASENRCECVVSANSTNVYFGYYELFSNSEVRAYADGSNYTGTYVFWTGAQINAAAQMLTGITPLVTNITPEPGTSAAQGGVSIIASPELRLPVRAGRGDTGR